MQEIERESLEVDVLFVGAGPGSLAGAYRLATIAEAEGRELEIAVIDKSGEIGDHGVSGAVLDPVALAELMPDFLERGCPIERTIAHDEVRFLTTNGSIKIPGFAIPSELHNVGFYAISLGRFVKWLAEKVEEKGIYILPATTAVEVLYDGDKVVGVRTGDKGLDKDGKHKPNFEAGTLLKAKITIFGEGPRGTVSEDLINRRGLRDGKQPQVFSLGCKEIIQTEGTDFGGIVVHTMGYPLPPHVFGGGFLYELQPGYWSIGLVAGLAWRDPSFDCFEALQNLKKHPAIQKYIRGGEVLSYGAKTIPEGGYFSLPQLYTDGAMLIGDSAGLVDVKRLKGIPHAMKSGMLAADVAAVALAAKDMSASFLERYEQRVKDSWIGKDLWKRRNFRSSFDGGNLYRGLAKMFFREATGGGPKTAPTIEPDHRMLRHTREFKKMPEPTGYDPSVIIDKLTAVHRSGTLHREDQSSHIRILDPGVCVDRCIATHGTAPCTHFCPAQVYELVGESDKHIQVNFSNCVHCKTCGILDPIDVAGDDHIQNIEWRAPNEGGPRYQRL